MSRVFITGASGFIGSTLARAFRERGDEVRGVDMRADPANGVVAGDIGEPGAWQEHAAGSDLVVHTAAVVSNAVSLDRMWRINVLGTKHVVDAAEQAGATRLINFSSVRAFSDVDFPDGVTEDHPVRTDGSPYVDTKVAGEQVVLQAHAAGRVPVTVVRPGDVYGPGSRPWTILPVEMIKRHQLVLPAGGKGVFSPVYIDDLVDGILLAATSPQAVGQVFTLSGGVGVSCAEFFGHYHRMLGIRGPRTVPTPLAVAGSALVAGAARVARRETELNPATVRYLARTGTYSIAKARSVLGYSPRVGLAEGMARTEAWLRENGHLGRG